MFKNITGKIQRIRNDTWGRGEFGARRRRTDGTRYTHQGVDYVVSPGQELCMPYPGKYARSAYPHADSKAFSGALFVSERVDFKILYFRPLLQISEKVETGQVIGIAQDISARYGLSAAGGKMVPHIHFEITRIDPELLKEYYGYQRRSRNSWRRRFNLSRFNVFASK